MFFEIAPSVYIPALVALVISVASHQLTVRRELRAKRRELRLSYLIKSYRTLSKAVGHPKLHEMSDELQEAIADIQFLGTVGQAKLASNVAQKLGNEGSADFTSLLYALRDELRRELALGSIDSRIWWVRIRPKNHGYTEYER